MLITGVITACSCNTLKPKALLAEQEGRTGLVQFPLLDLVKWAEPIGEAVSTKSGWLHKVIA